MRCINWVPLDWAALLLLVALPALSPNLPALAPAAFAQKRQQEAANLDRVRAREIGLAKQVLEAQLLRQRAINLDLIGDDPGFGPTVEQLVFGRDGGREMARQQLEILQEREIEDLVRTCNLSPAQKAKVTLLCRGDVKRFFDQVEILINRQAAKEPNATIEPDARRLFVLYSSGLFHQRSLLLRTLPTVLDADQLAKHEVELAARKQVVHAKAIQQVVALVGRRASLTATERQKLSAFLARETKPPAVSFGYDHYYLLVQLGNLDEATLKLQFSDRQLPTVRELIERAKTLKPNMHMFGYFADSNNDT